MWQRVSDLGRELRRLLVNGVSPEDFVEERASRRADPHSRPIVFGASAPDAVLAFAFDVLAGEDRGPLPLRETSL